MSNVNCPLSDIERKSRLIYFHRRTTWPRLAIGGKAVLFTIVTTNEWDRGRVVVQSLVTGERRELVQGGADGQYVPAGHLLFMKMGTLMAVPLDVRTLQVTG